MSKHTWHRYLIPIPFLSALFAGSCRESKATAPTDVIDPMDWRQAICTLCVGLVVQCIVNAIRVHDRETSGK